MLYQNLNAAISLGYQGALKDAKRGGPRGCYRSRGKWVVVTRKDGGEPLVAMGALEWKGTKKQFDSLLAEYGENPLVAGLFIEGGVDYAASVNDFTDGCYDPWVSEWSVTVFLRS
jgi:hypothetical protein